MDAVAYARYSTSNQTENSIAYQLAEIEKYCREQNIRLIGTYTDEAESGTNTDRPGFQAMCRDAQRRHFDAVVIYDISRGSRDVGDWFTFRKAMMMLGVQVISATQKLGDITKSDDFLVELISVGLGQREVLETRQKSINGVAVRAKEGVFLGGTPPLGYDIVDQQYVINSAEAKTVRTIFSMYARGRSYNDILEACKGAVGKMGRPLGKNSLHSILTNERYIGVYTWNKRHTKMFRKWAGGTPNENVTRIENKIPPIIDSGTWMEVQKRMENSQRNASNKAKEEYLLSGLIECSACGATYVGHTSKKKNGQKNRYYCCGNKQRTRTCTNPNVNADNLENVVLEGVREYLKTTDYDSIAAEINKQIRSASKDLTAEKKELAEVERQISNGTKAILRGLDYPELQDEISRLRVRREELKDVITISERENKAVSADDVRAVFEGALSDLQNGNPKAAIRSCVQKIYANTDGSFSVDIGVHTSGCGSAQHVVCAPFILLIRKLWKPSHL